METLDSLFAWILVEGEEPAPLPIQIERAFRMAQRIDGPGPDDVVCYFPNHETRERIIWRAWVHVTLWGVNSVSCRNSQGNPPTLVGSLKESRLFVPLGNTLSSGGEAPG